MLTFSLQGIQEYKLLLTIYEVDFNSLWAFTFEEGDSWGGGTGLDKCC
jgi:hypothetical protein